MPPPLLLTPLPTFAKQKYPTPTPPANVRVEADITQQQLAIFEELWATVNRTCVYEDFNGQDWEAIGGRYRQLIEAGLTDEDFYTAMDHMIAELGDEHSFFESPDEARESDAQFEGTFEYVGVGILVAPVPEAGAGVILFAFPDSPALEAGLGPHDSILAVDGYPMLEADGSLTNRIRGPENTSVTLTLRRPGGEPFDVTLTRRRISGATLIDYCAIPGTRIAYLFLPNLESETLPAQMREALAALTASGPLQGLILDNRQNHGGQLPVLEAVLGFFTEGPVGHFVNRRETRLLEIEPEDVNGSQTVPLVVLVDVDTVSFGEVLSGVLENQGRAQLVGQTTLGNVETLWGYDFDDGSRAWIASETFQPLNQPNGIWEQTGIEPDVSAPTRWDLFVEATDPALGVAVELLLAEN
jgi:C-terminal peptidase prc